MCLTIGFESVKTPLPLVLSQTAQTAQAAQADSSFAAKISAQGHAIFTKVKDAISHYGPEIEFWAGKYTAFCEHAKFSVLKEALKVALIAAVIGWGAYYVVPSYVLEVVAVPIMEEVLFRGIVQTGLECLQSMKNEIGIRYYKETPSEADLSSQKKFRVITTAVLFGLAHLKGVAITQGAIQQAVLAFIFGISAGYLKEKTHSVVLPIFYHMASNGLIFLSLEAFVAALPITMRMISSKAAINLFKGWLITSTLMLDATVYYQATKAKPVDLRDSPHSDIP